MKNSNYTFIQLISGLKAREIKIRQSIEDSLQQEISIPGFYFKTKLINRIYNFLKKTIRTFVIAIYLFPILIIFKIILNYINYQLSDAITIFYVILVVLFALFFNLFFIFYIIIRSRSLLGATNQLNLRGVDKIDSILKYFNLNKISIITTYELQQLIRSSNLSNKPLFRIKGRILESSKEKLDDEVILRDCWVSKKENFTHITDGAYFSIKNKDLPPIIIKFETTPIIIGDYKPLKYSEYTEYYQKLISEKVNHFDTNKIDLSSDQGAYLENFIHVTFKNNEEVELIGIADQLIDDLYQFELDGKQLDLYIPQDSSQDSFAPYRETKKQEGILIVCSSKSPMIIVKNPQ